MLFLSIWETEWMSYIFMAFAMGVAGLITYGFTLFNAWLKTKIKNEKMKKLLSAMTTIIESAVQSVQQSFVSQLKKDGKFDKEAQKQALNLAIMKVKHKVTAETQLAIAEFFGDFDEFIEDQIEAYIGLWLEHESISSTKHVIKE